MFLKTCFFLQIILLSIFTLTASLNILAVMPTLAKSHQLVFDPLFKKLASNGHNLTVITRYPQTSVVPNWRDVHIGDETGTSELLTFHNMSETRLAKYKMLNFMEVIAREVCTKGLTHPNYQSFLKEDNQFDVILIEVFNTPCFMEVAKRFNAPVIGLSSCTWMPWMFKMFGSSSNPSHVPNIFLDQTNHMSFLARVENTLTFFLNNIYYKYFIDNPNKEWTKEYTGIDLNEGADIMSDISLLLLNSHFTLNMKVPLSPNSIEVAGIHIDSKSVKPLQQDLEKFISESQHGVIYMSMGSFMRGDSMPEAKKQAFLKAFSRLPQRILWKWEGEMKNKPDNVMTHKWIPQWDVLCHPNVKGFISHTGLLGTIESVNCAKPLLMIPLFGDQFTNAAFVEENGGGIVLPFSEITEEAIYEKLQRLLTPQMKETAKNLSDRFKDRPLSPMNTALYWIDYVVRHKGAHFMKMTSVDMPFYQFYLLDVLAFVFTFIVVFMYLSYSFLKFIFLICKRQEKVKQS